MAWLIGGVEGAKRGELGPINGFDRHFHGIVGLGGAFVFIRIMGSFGAEMIFGSREAVSGFARGVRGGILRDNYHSCSSMHEVGGS